MIACLIGQARSILAFPNMKGANVLSSLLERALLKFCRSPESVASPHNEESCEHAEPLALLEKVYPDLRARVGGARVLDFGSGFGEQSVALAEIGACRVLGVDINAEWRRRAGRLAESHGVSDRVQFTDKLSASDRGQFTFVFSQNSMEHFPDPAQVLRTMASALAPNGQLLITFGLPWFSPYGAHMHYFTMIPWVHLIFPERVIMRVRSRYKNDGARRYVDVEGGLNQMSLRKFRRLVKSSGLRVVRFSTEPVKGQRLLASIPVLREMFTNHVTAVLEKASHTKVG